MGKKMQMITDKELMSKIYKQQHNSTSKNQTINQMTRLKMGKRNESTLFSKGKCRWPTGHEKMLNITNDQGNANQNHN